MPMSTFRDPVSLHDKTKVMNVDHPFIVSSLEYVKREEYVVASDLFKRKWLASERRISTKRGGRPIGDSDPLQMQVSKGM